jgi:GNAT superfamily N-acetyltransferase
MGRARIWEAAVTIAFRAAVGEQERFLIVSAWTQNYKHAKTRGFIQAEDWYRVMDEQVDKALKRPDVRTIVAYNVEATDHVADVHGFITADTEERPPLVYYVFVKENYRREGIARGLFAAMGIDPTKPFNYVCSTPFVRRLERKIPLAKWEPDFGTYPKAERKRGRP